MNVNVALPSILAACRSRARTRRAAGFSFIEIVVVMGAMAVLLGLAVGFISNLGQSTYVAQAKAMLSETAYRCVSASAGGRRAVLTLRVAIDDDGDPALKIGAIVTRPVLTHQFESLDFASEARAPNIQGKVELLKGQGHIGNCAKFGGGYLEFTPQSLFAMTEGLEFDVWIQPEANHTLMSLMRGGESYEITLVQVSQSDAYDVRLSLQLRKASEGSGGAALSKVYETKGGPVVADGRWSRVQVMFDGLEPTIRVNGLDCYNPDAKSRRPGAAFGPEDQERVHRIAVPREGAVGLSLSSGQRPYYGLMDSVRLMGVFQSEELERTLPGSLEVLYPPIPMRIVFFNGALDPDEHDGDQIVRIRDLRNLNDPPLRLTIGMYGAISSVFEAPGSAGPDEPNPRRRTGSAGAAPEDK